MFLHKFHHLLSLYSKVIRTYEGNSTGSGNHDSPCRRHSDDVLTSHWCKYYTVKAVHVVEIVTAFISRYGLKIFVYINRILTKVCLWKPGGPLIINHRNNRSTAA